MPRKSPKKTKFDFKNVKGDIGSRIPYIKILNLSIAINVLVIILSIVLKNKLPPEIPLYYGLPSGTGQLADRVNIILPSIAAISCIVVNTVIILIIENEFLKKSLVITGFVLSMFSLTTTLKIMLLVGNF